MCFLGSCVLTMGCPNTCISKVIERHWARPSLDKRHLHVFPLGFHLRNDRGVYLNTRCKGWDMDAKNGIPVIYIGCIAVHLSTDRNIQEAKCEMQAAVKNMRVQSLKTNPSTPATDTEVHAQCQEPPNTRRQQHIDEPQRRGNIIWRKHLAQP